MIFELWQYSGSDIWCDKSKCSETEDEHEAVMWVLHKDYQEPKLVKIGDRWASTSTELKLLVEIAELKGASDG